MTSHIRKCVCYILKSKEKVSKMQYNVEMLKKNKFQVNTNNFAYNNKYCLSVTKFLY